MAVEIRSVNSRFLDLSLKLPDELRGLEGSLRDLLSAGLRRGKVELRLLIQSAEPASGPEISPTALQRLAVLQEEVRRRMPQAPALSVHEVLQWCRLQGAPQAAVADDVIMKTAAEGLAALKESRQREGDKLRAALMERVARLRTLAAQAEPLIPALVQRQQARFLERWQEALQLASPASPANGPTPDSALARDRALQEATAFAIRIDVAEELSRLAAHLDEIERLLDQGGELGKRLDFLTQELHREANTLGAKSAVLELSTLSMEMKVLIEQMREQVQNIE